MMRRVACLLMLGPLLAAAAVRAKTPGELQIGDSLREATLAGLNGASSKLSDYRGKPLIINVWASWCGPCRAEMASLERLAWLDPAGHFAVIGISTDDDPAQAKALLARANATISQYIDFKLQMENMLGATRLPLTVLVDADGRVLDKIYGARQWDEPESLQLLNKLFRIRLAPPR
jgi:thiol-disulfide isomerase/thioredoxin